MVFRNFAYKKMTNSINLIQDQIIAEFSQIKNGVDKYHYLIKLGQDLQPNTIIRTDNNLIANCQSNVWLTAINDSGKLKFIIDSDAAITKGIISLIMRVVNDQSPASIYNSELYFIEKIGLKSNLSPARSDGIKSIINRVNEIARVNC